MQGQLRKEHLLVEIRSQCAHCARPLRITFDSDMQWQVHEEDAEPLVFMPDLDWKNFAEPNIIDAY